jgi:hypothetical protein
VTTTARSIAHRRPTRRLLLSLAFGAVVTVCFSLAGARDSHVHPVAQRANQPLRHADRNAELPFVVVERDWTRDAWRVERAATPVDDDTARRAQMSPEFRAIANGDAARAAHLRAGWPFRAFEAMSVERGNGETPRAIGGAVVPRSWLDRRVTTGTVVLPLRPLWPGLAADVAIFAACGYLALSLRAAMRRVEGFRWRLVPAALALFALGGVGGTVGAAWWAGAYDDAAMHASRETRTIGTSLTVTTTRGSTRVAWTPVLGTFCPHGAPTFRPLDADWKRFSPAPAVATLESIDDPHRTIVELRGWPWPALAARTAADFDERGRAIPASITVADAIVLETRDAPDRLPSVPAGREQSLARFLPLRILPRGFGLGVLFYGMITLGLVWLLDPLLPFRVCRTT